MSFVINSPNESSQHGPFLSGRPNYASDYDTECELQGFPEHLPVPDASATVVWALALLRWTDAAIPWRDAFVAAFSVAAQILQARKNVETWPAWVIVNAVAIPAYWSATLAYTAFLYLLYLGLAFEGWREWRRAMKR